MPFPLDYTWSSEMMTRLIIALVLGLSGWDCLASGERLLVYSQTTSFHHLSIADGIAALKKGAVSEGYTLDFSEDAAYFTQENLGKYQGIVLMSPSGNNFNLAQRAAFEEFFHQGGGVAGIHDAISGPLAYEWEWPWYVKLNGAVFINHSDILPATVKVVDATHPSTMGLPAKWVHTDEWYNYKFDDRTGMHVLLNLEETTYTGGTMGADHPAAWTRDIEGGHAWFTILGHTSEDYTDSIFLSHFWGGIRSVVPKPVSNKNTIMPLRTYGSIMLTALPSQTWMKVSGDRKIWVDALGKIGAIQIEAH